MGLKGVYGLFQCFKSGSIGQLDPNPDQGPGKKIPKKEKSGEISCFELHNVRFGGLEPYGDLKKNIFHFSIKNIFIVNFQMLVFWCQNLGLDPDPGLTKKPGSGFNEYLSTAPVFWFFFSADGIQHTQAHKGKLRNGTRSKTKNKKLHR